jgi:hypothetical protein
MGDYNVEHISLSNPGAKSITINAPVSNNADLASLNVSGHSISPSFDANKTTYSLAVDAGVSVVTVNATTAAVGATITGAGVRSLNYGDNTIMVTVKAPAGNTKTYAINVKRAQIVPNTNLENEGVARDDRVLSSDSKLVSLKASVGDLEPDFHPDQNSYSVKVANDVTRISFEYEVSDKLYAVVEKSGGNDLKVGKNTIVFKVTAEDGSTNSYTVVVTREGKDGENALSPVMSTGGDGGASNVASDGGGFRVVLYVILGTVGLAACTALLVLKKKKTQTKSGWAMPIANAVASQPAKEVAEAKVATETSKAPEILQPESPKPIITGIFG